MKSFTSVLFYRIFRTTFYTSVALTFCAWIVQSSKYLQLLNNNLSLAKFLRLTSFLTVDIMAFVLPIALGISAAFVYQRLAESNQIVVIQSAGISPQKILKPLLKLGLIIVGALYICNDYLSPLAWREFRKMEFNIRNNIEPPNNAGPIFCGEKLAVYAQKYLGGFVFGNIFVVDTRDPNKADSFFAKVGSIQKNILILSDGEKAEVNFNNHEYSLAKFKSYEYNLKDLISFETQVHANEKFPSELLKDNSPEKVKEQKALFHQKMLSPLLAIIFSLLAFLLIALAPYKRKTTQLRMGIFIGLMILFQGVFLAFANLAAKNPIFVEINYVFVLLLLFVLSIVAERK